MAGNQFLTAPALQADQMQHYVFWKTPEGKPYGGTDGKHAPAEILANIGETSTVNEDGSISRPLTTLFRSELAVYSAAVIVDPNTLYELNEDDTKSILSKAMTRVIKKSGGRKPVEQKALITAANEVAAEFFRKSLDDYVLVTSLSVESWPTRPIAVNGWDISSVTNRQSMYPLPDALKRQQFADILERHDSSRTYQSVAVKTKGRSVEDAASNAIDAINLLRGLWTLAATFRSWSMQLVPRKPEAIGIIHTGPIHTMHWPDGSPAADVFWYEPTADTSRKTFSPKYGWDKLDGIRNDWIDNLSTFPDDHRRDIDRLVIRYAVALDHSNLDVSFLQMWSILEKITGTVGANYEETIRRATWAYADRAMAKEVLATLRLRRNQYVHAAKSGDDPDQVAYLLKSFIDAHLLRLIVNTFDVESLAEYVEFLSLPCDVGELARRRNLHEKAIEFRKPMKETTDDSP